MFRKITLVSAMHVIDPSPGRIHHQTFTVHSDGRMYWSVSLYTGHGQETDLAESVYRRMTFHSAHNILTSVEECLARPERRRRIDDTGWGITAVDTDGKTYREVGTDPFKDVRGRPDLSDYIRRVLDNYTDRAVIKFRTRDMWLFEPMDGSRSEGIDNYGDHRIYERMRIY